MDLSDSDLAEFEEGRRAAERLCSTWPETDWVPVHPSPLWAQGAIAEFAQRMRQQDPIFRASQRGAEVGASMLSPRPFQGLSEALQNADDLGATELRIAIRRQPRLELLIVHNGKPVSLAHLGAMVLPWLSTKANDDSASGRFGIGQKTLKALGSPLEMHCAPFHFVMHDDGPEAYAPSPLIDGVYDPACRETMLIVPLYPAVELSEVSKAVESLGVESMLFLRSIRRLSFSDLEEAGAERSYAIDIASSREIDNADVSAHHHIRHDRLTIREPQERAGLRFDRYWSEKLVAEGETRLNKATGGLTPLGLCISVDAEHRGSVHDRIPLPIGIAAPISINAQFDPDAARTTILDTQWNKRRLADLGHLLGSVALDAFDRDPTVAWTHVPLTTEGLRTRDWIREAFASDVIDVCHARLKEDLQLPTTAGKVALSEIVYADEKLEPLLTSADLEFLAPGMKAIDPACQDDVGRWRQVMDDLGEATSLDPVHSLALFDAPHLLDGRTASWFVSMAALSIEQGFWAAFIQKNAFVLSDGRVVGCPPRGGPRIFVLRDHSQSLASRLGLALPLNDAYLTAAPAAEKVIAKLREMHILRDDCDQPSEALKLLARSDKAAGAPVRLEDDELLALRDAWAELPRDEQRTTGEKIGANIELRTIVYRRGRQPPEQGWSCPHLAYQPAAIDRETESFAKAAGRTPGLVWIDPDYGKILKHDRGRGEAGAQRFLSALGVSRDPRLIAPLNESPKWSRDPRPASAVYGVNRPEAQLRAIRTAGGDHLLDDRWSPDLEVVVKDIQSCQARLKKPRAMALLAVLNRGWERRYSEHQVASCVLGYNGYWNSPRDVQATWLARLASASWLPSGTGALKAPSQLALPTDANRLTYGADKGAYLAKIDHKAIRPELLTALGVMLGPSGEDLIKSLQNLRLQPLTAETRKQVHTVYQLLAADLRSNAADLKAGRAMTPLRLRNAFRASAGHDGLLLCDQRWCSPETVLRGAPIFGNYRVFAPHIAGLEPLWTALGIPEPSARDCVDVLRDLSRKSELTASDRGIMLTSFRALAARIADATPQLAATLKRFPLWTGKGWTSQRPIYVLDGEAISEADLPGFNVWRLGLSNFSDLAPLFDVLGITRLRLESFRPRALCASGIAEGEGRRKLFAEAVALLRDELIRTDVVLYESLKCSWMELLQARFVIDHSLEIIADLEGHPPIRIPARAHMMTEPLTMIVRSLEDTGASQAGGQAVASLFDGDRQKLAWAWASVWHQTRPDRQVGQIILPSAKPEGAGVASRLSALQAQAGERSDSQKKTPKPLRGKAAAKTQSPIQVRRLREIDDLEPSQGTIVNEGTTNNGLVFVKSRTKGQSSRVYNPAAGSNGGAPKPSTRTVLPPVGDREQLALEAVRRALRLDPEQLQDVRARRGIGVDAIDELRQCYEIKMSSGSAFPSDITLTPSEVDAAQNDPDFFLAVVVGLEEGEGCLKVRFIFNPLEQLAAKIRGEVTLTGVDKAEALEYEFSVSDLT